MFIDAFLADVVVVVVVELAPLPLPLVELSDVELSSDDPLLLLYDSLSYSADLDSHSYGGVLPYDVLCQLRPAVLPITPIKQPINQSINQSPSP